MENAFTQSIYREMFKPLGEVILHSKLPDEFELYLISLQVVDDDENRIVDYLIFPVNPSSVMKVQKGFTNVKKGFNSVHVNENDTFFSFPINMSGNFGRAMKVVMCGNATIPLKNGYGITKYLSNLIKLSKGSNAKGKPYRTILYNLAFGESVSVEIMDCKFSQTERESRIWSYDLNMVAVAPAIIGNNGFNYSLSTLLSYTVVSRGFNRVLGTLSPVIKKEG